MATGGLPALAYLKFNKLGTLELAGPSSAEDGACAKMLVTQLGHTWIELDCRLVLINLDRVLIYDMDQKLSG